MIKSGLIYGVLLVCMLGCSGKKTESTQYRIEYSTVEPSAAIERDVALVKNERRVLEAFRYVEELKAETLRDHIYITEIPAPPFNEHERAEAFKILLKDAGADTVWIDAVGNVIARRDGVDKNRTVALAAHLDTVFPEGTDVTVKMRGDTLFAPGISDDSRGLAEVLTLLRVMELANIRTNASLLFIGTVGEEGLGDLRGVKHLFSASGPGIDSWIAIDGGKTGNIVYKGLGSHRYRVTFEGPGGHSWGAFGMVNPHHALGEAIQRFVEKADTYTRIGPRTSYSVGRIGGGTSINSIPFSSWMEVDIRSVERSRLQKMDSLLYLAVYEALEVHNAMRRAGTELTVSIDKIGDRPSGALDPTLPLIQRAAVATILMGEKPSYSLSSTDSNIPISLGIPAITIGRGGQGGNAHALNEWWIDDQAELNVQWALLIAIAEAGLAS